MVKRFDHLTIVVRDVERAKGEPFASYMGVPDIKAEHVTLDLGECLAAN